MAPKWKNGPSDACMLGQCPACGADWAGYLTNCTLDWRNCQFTPATPEEIAKRLNPIRPTPIRREWYQPMLY